MPLTQDRANEMAASIVAPFLEIAQTKVSFDAVEDWKRGIAHLILKEFENATRTQINE